MNNCLICGASIKQFLDFGKMPIANGFLKEEQFEHEYFFNLAVSFCPNCTMVQLSELVDREKMFHEKYAYFSSISVRMTRHFEALAGKLFDRTADRKDPFIVEIGSNDGILLQHAAKRGIRHLGVEPSGNVADAAREKGIRTITRFFDQETARAIREEDGKADVIVGANVMCHIPYIHSVAQGVEILLEDTGILVFEDPYVGDILEKTSYDQIYDEHAFYFSVSSIQHLFAEHGLELVDVEPLPVHGGSMRYFLARKGRFPISDRVRRQEQKEIQMGLHRLETFEKLAADVDRSRTDLRKLLSEVRGKDTRVAGYGATSKSTTVLNYCKIGPELIEFISDTTPTKQGRFTPGMHIPVKPYSAFSERYPEFTVLFAWNHAEEILEKESEYMAAGGKFIGYVPQVGIIGGKKR